MSDNTQSVASSDERQRAHKREFHAYVWGLGLALALTLVPFALVHWRVGNRSAILVVLAALAVTQMAVHFRFFLHLNLHRNREDLHLILFSGLLLAIMVAGTLWIMTNLAARMAVPM